MFRNPEWGDDRFELWLVAIANLLPLAGYGVLDWEFITVVQLYCLDAITLLVVYGGCAMFAQRNSLVEEREETLLPVIGGGTNQSDEPWTIDLHRSLPSIYPRNLRIVVPPVLFCVFLVLSAGVVLTGQADWSGGGRPAVPISPFLAALSEFTSPLVLGAALAIVAAHLVTVPRGYFRRRRHEALSAYTTLELPVRFVLLYGGFVTLYFFVGLSILLFAESTVAESNAERVGTITVLSGFFVMRIALERERFRAERSTDPDGLAAWVVPTDPRSERG
ncbi:hypothetical protein [Natrinema sp. 74]|uniref:hypothetical protein n=1 Tax=Natrinema sp. 74 TaxID=3384159 RepID=UPI0038D3F9D6